VPFRRWAYRLFVALWESHDSVLVEARGGSARFVVRRVQTNEAAIALISVAVLAWIVFIVASVLVRYSILATLLLAAVVAVKRAFRIRIETSGEHVRVLNYWRTFEFEWADVKDVGVGSLTQGPLPQPALALVFGAVRSSARRRRRETTPKDRSSLGNLPRERRIQSPGALIFLASNTDAAWDSVRQCPLSERPPTVKVRSLNERSWVPGRNGCGRCSKQSGRGRSDHL
jgi:hypothetical protein